MRIYVDLCSKILNYYLEVMGNYKLSFTIKVSKEYLIYNFYVINYELCNFISNIISQIHPNTIFNNKNIKKYFNDLIDELKEELNNFKYNPPYLICFTYLSCLMDNKLLPTDVLEFINNLTWETFLKDVLLCLQYSREYYILIGIKKYGFDLNIDKDTNYILKNDDYITSIIDSISLNWNKYLITDNTNDNIIVEPKLKFKNLNISLSDINSNEINNCFIRYWNINNIKINCEDDVLDINISKNIIKMKLISEFISNIFGEPLFDKIRTIDKLGYIVKVDNKTVINNNRMYFIILFLVQSSYTIERISSSFDDFNQVISLDIKNNYDNYLEKFRLIKESKLIDFKKPFSNLSEEITMYLESIISKIHQFNLSQLYLEVCENINWSDIEPIILKIINNKIKNYDLKLNKN